MYYLVLNFENAGLILTSYTTKAANKNFVRNCFGGQGQYEEVGGHDLKTPIPYTLLSNVLHVLCGKRPVPTKQFSFFERNKTLDEIAKKSYVHYNFKPLDEEGKMQFYEQWQTAKVAFNSKRKISTTFKTVQGDKTYLGHYSNSYLYQTFSNKDDYKKFCDFLSELVGKDFHRFNLSDFVMEISKQWGNAYFEEKFDKFLSENESIEKALKVWVSVFRGKEEKRENHGHYTRTPVMNIKGINRKVTLHGQIMCPIDDEQILNDIRNNGGSARLLEGGFVYIDKLLNDYEMCGITDYWEKIYNEEDVQMSETEEVA